MLSERNHPILDEQPMLFALFMEHLPGSAWIKDVNGRYVYANKNAERKWGKSLSELFGKSDAEIFSPSTADQFRENDELVIATRKSLRTVETMNDGLHFELVQKFPIFDEQGEPAYIGGIALDVSELKQAQETLEKALREAEQIKDRLLIEQAYLREELKTQHDFEEMIGASVAFRKSLRDLNRVAATDASVLILGETGTGKELFARAIHNLSRRRDRPLIKLNCAAISSGLVDSELFGHERGAFTGAIQRRIGRFELADKGTLFLDEVGDLAPDIQIKLLRVLQEGEFERVGSNKTIKVDVRIIAATNRKLQDALRAGSFRSDLFYRLNVFPLEAPPLRDRSSDIPLLARFFLSKFAKKLGKESLDISDETMTRLMNYAWPGNIRELQNVIERAVILSTETVLDVSQSMLPEHYERAEEPASPASGAARPIAETDFAGKADDVQRRHILEVLERTRWVIEGPHGAATKLGLKPSTLRNRMHKLRITKS